MVSAWACRQPLVLGQEAVDHGLQVVGGDSRCHAPSLRSLNKMHCECNISAAGRRGKGQTCGDDRPREDR